MVKIRICSEDPQEVEQVIDLFNELFPDMRFSAVRLGGNPKYADDPKYFSYGEPRIRNKRPVDINFSAIHRTVMSNASKSLPEPQKRRNSAR